MRIRSVSIRSFGSLRDRSYGVSEGMTVFHGPNESGKTTVMEFIRTCLVPSNKRNQYPAREKTDSGTLVYEQDGEERTLRLVQKTVGGDRPRMPTGTDDPSLFRSVFAMTPADLDDEKVVTEGGIRSRFLTVPGGDAMPSARAAAEEVWSKTLGKRSNSSSRVIALESESSALDAEISQASSLTDSYGQLDRQRSELSVRLSALQEESRSSAAAKTVHDVYVSNTGNYGRLRSLSEEREALGEFVTVTAEDEAEMARLRAESAQRQTALKELQERRSSEEADLMGADRRKVAARSAAIAGRIHDDGVVSVAPSLLPKHKFQTVVYDIADLGIRKAALLGVLLGPLHHALHVGGLDGHAGGHLGDARIARRAVELGDPGALGQLPADGVLAASAAHD